MVSRSGTRATQVLPVAAARRRRAPGSRGPAWWRRRFKIHRRGGCDHARDQEDLPHELRDGVAFVRDGIVGAGAANYGFGAPAAGVSGRMGEQGGLRTGWIAAFSTEGYEGEPPLLEELGVNFGHIQAKVRSRGFHVLPRPCDGGPP